MLGDSMRRRHRVGTDDGRGRRPPARWGRWLGIGIIAAAIAFGGGYGAAALVLFPAPERGQAGVAVPELVGLSLTEARRQLALQELEAGDVVELPAPDRPEGVVLAQSPVPGQQLRAGARVRLAVSAAASEVIVPDVQGFDGGEATELLEQLGFGVRRTEEQADAPRGRVLRTRPTPGTRLEAGGVVQLVVSAGEPRRQAPDSLLTPFADSLLLPGDGDVGVPPAGLDTFDGASPPGGAPDTLDSAFPPDSGGRADEGTGGDDRSDA